MVFDPEKFKKKFIPPKPIQIEQSGHMLLYEALLSKVDRLRSSTMELSLKIVWYHHADHKPRCTSIHNFVSILHHGELTDFAKIINGFMSEENQMTSHVEMDELISKAQEIVDTINSEEVYCFCHINNKNRIGKRLVRFELTSKVHPILNRKYCDGFRDLQWFIPEGYENEGKFKNLQRLNFKRNGLSLYEPVPDQPRSKSLTMKEMETMSDDNDEDTPDYSDEENVSY